MTEETPTPAPKYGNIAHPAWRLFFLLFSGLFWFELANEFGENSIGGIIQDVTFGLGFLGMAVFAKKLERSAAKRQFDNPNAALDILHSPLKHLLVSILSMEVVAVVMAFDVVLVDPVKVALAMLGGAVSLFLWMYVAMRLANQGRLARFFVCTPLLVGFPASICYIVYLNNLLTDLEAGFPWPIFGVVLAVFTGISTMNPAVQLGGEPAETEDNAGSDPVETEEQTSEEESK